MVTKRRHQEGLKKETYQKAYRAKKEGAVKKTVNNRVRAQKAANAHYGADDSAQRKVAGSLDKAIRKATK